MFLHIMPQSRPRQPRALLPTAIATVFVYALLAASNLAAQSFADYTEFYRLLRVGADEQFQFCYPTTSAVSEPFAVGVRRDSLGRPVQIGRFRFGNPDSRSDWATMLIIYRRYDSLDIVLERRSYLNAGGQPVDMDRAAYEDVYRRRSGALIQRKILDRSGNPVNDSADVHRSLFKLIEPGTYLQEWYYSSGKLHYGAGSDGVMRPFSAMPIQAYYRQFQCAPNGALLREQVMTLSRKPLLFPEGVYVHAYTNNDCGQAVRMAYQAVDGSPMADSNGIAAITFSYDDAGRMVEWRLFGLNGKPLARESDGVAGMRYTYRAFDGVLVKEERLNDDGEPIP